MSLVKVIANESEFQQTVHAAPPPQLVVVDFTAVWCPPCQTMKPVFDDLSKRYRHVTFCSVDVDAVQTVAKEAGITAMPTFQFYKAGKKIGEMKGANPGGLEQLVKQYQGPIDQDIMANATSLSGHSDLSYFIARSQVECLNEQSEHPVANVWTDGPAFVASDVDEQLIITIPFNQPVKIHSIKLKAPSEKGPVSIKTFINLPNSPDFEEAVSLAGVETLALTLDSYDKVLPLRFVKYQYVHSLTLFICGSAEEESVVIERLYIYGTPAEASKGSLQSANPADAAAAPQ